MNTGNVSLVVGNTPLIELTSLSKLTGCRILGKAEFLNPGGSVKDRAALGIIQQAEKDGLLKPGYTIVEGTAGNTGIGLATIAAQRGYKCVIVMPNNQSEEKYQTLKALAVELITVDPCPFANPNHFYHTAKKIAEERNAQNGGVGFFWANQFENTANGDFHFQTTGPEIWTQTLGKVDAFVSASGTGGTISGVSRYLKSKNRNVHIRLADPFGSGSYSFFKTGKYESSGSSFTEGIGIMRLTENFKTAVIDDAVQVTDQEMMNMLYHLARHDGLLVGTSAGINVFAAYQYGLQNKNSGKTIVTALCDSGLRYQSRIFNEKFLTEKNIDIKPL